MRLSRSFLVSLVLAAVISFAVTAAAVAPPDRPPPALAPLWRWLDLRDPAAPPGSKRWYCCPALGSCCYNSCGTCPPPRPGFGPAR